MNDLSAVASADSDLVDLSADIVCAYVSHNALSVTDLPKLIADVHAALRALKGGDAAEPAPHRQPPSRPANCSGHRRAHGPGGLTDLIDD